MNNAELIGQAKRLLNVAMDTNETHRAVVAAQEFFRRYAGSNSAFYALVTRYDPQTAQRWARDNVIAALRGFIEEAENGTLESLSPQRQAQIDVVSDFLAQAQELLDDRKVHPAAPAVIIGAALEEFLRNWVDEAEISLDSKSQSLDGYCRALREADLITKQDVKDITSWSGLRNHAAHGEWDQVGDKSRVTLMLEGVNLFMRRYGPESRESPVAQ